MKSYEGDGYYEFHESKESLMEDYTPYCADCGESFDMEDLYIFRENKINKTLCADCLKARRGH